MTRDEELEALRGHTPERLYWERRGPHGETITLFAPNFVDGSEVHPWNLLNTDANEWDMQGEKIRKLFAAAPDLLRELIEARELLRRATMSGTPLEQEINAFLDGETKTNDKAR